MDIIKPFIITATIPVIIFMAGITLLLMGIDFIYDSYHEYFFSNPSN